MSNAASFRALATTFFSKTAWIAAVALVASLLVVVPGGSQPANAVPIAVPTSISVGDTNTCHVINGGVQCWGDNSYGQLGVLGVAKSSTAVQTIAADSRAPPRFLQLFITRVRLWPVEFNVGEPTLTVRLAMEQPSLA